MAEGWNLNDDWDVEAEFQPLPGAPVIPLPPHHAGANAIAAAVINGLLQLPGQMSNGVAGVLPDLPGGMADVNPVGGI